MPPLSPSRQKISALLRKAGCTASKTYATRVRGWHNYTRGYILESSGPRSVRIRYCDGGRPVYSGADQRAAQLLEKAAEALKEFNPIWENDRTSFTVVQHPPGKTLVEVFAEEDKRHGDPTSL